MLTKDIADVVVKETMKRLGRNINIFDHNGIILSSGEKNRVDTFHEGALQVVKTQKPIVIKNSDVNMWRGVKPGINLPIVQKGSIIGVVGISGIPEEVQDFGSLVVLMTELLINQKLLSKEVEWKFRTRETIMDELLSAQPDLTKINQKLAVLNASRLSPPYFPIVFSFKQDKRMNDPLLSNMYREIEKKLSAYTCIYAFQDTETFCILVSAFSVEYKDTIYDMLERYFSAQFKHVSSASGYRIEELEEIPDLFNQLRIALQLTDKQRIHIKDVEIQLLLKNIQEEKRHRVKSRIELNLTQELKETLGVLFENDLNVQATAEALFIHRNTLLYRLKKIEELTGYNPRRFQDAVTLQISQWI